MDFLKTKIFKRNDTTEGSRIGSPSISGVFHSPSSSLSASSKKQKSSIPNESSSSQILPIVNKLGEELISDESLVEEIGITSTRSSVWIGYSPTKRTSQLSTTENYNSSASRIIKGIPGHSLHSENSLSECSYTPNTTTSSFTSNGTTQTYGAQTYFPSSLMLSSSTTSSSSLSLSPHPQNSTILNSNLSRPNLPAAKPPRTNQSSTSPPSSNSLTSSASISFLPEKRGPSETDMLSPSHSVHKVSRIRNLIGSNQSENQHKLLRLLMKPDLTVVQALCKSLLYEDEVTQMANSLISLFQHQGIALALIKNIIHSEIAKADDEGTLLRNTSAASILMSAYVRLNSFKYLSFLFKSLIHHLLSSKISIEIDPNRLEPGEDLEQNLANLFNVSKRFLEEICSSVEYCPRPLRFLSRILQQEVNEKFPGSAQTSMGGFFFLRFLCPAIVTPEAYNIIAPAALTKGSRRPLILISKVLQSLTNGVPFGDKEDYMVPLNQFIHENTQMLNNFFVSLTDVELEDQVVRYPAQTLKTSLIFISDCIHRHKTRIQEEILNLTDNIQLDYNPYEIFSLFLARKKKKKKLKPF